MVANARRAGAAKLRVDYEGALLAEMPRMKGTGS
jgi:hypothetical protein